MHATVPIETAKEHRVQITRRAGIVIAGQHMIQLVRILAANMAQRDASHAGSEGGVERHRKANPQIIAVLNSQSSTAVGHCARITA